MRAEHRPNLDLSGGGHVFAELVEATARGHYYRVEGCLRILKDLGWIIRRRRPREDGDAVPVFRALVRADAARDLSSIENCLGRLRELGWYVRRLHAGRRGLRAS